MAHPLVDVDPVAGALLGRSRPFGNRAVKEEPSRHAAQKREIGELRVGVERHARSAAQALARRPPQGAAKVVGGEERVTAGLHHVVDVRMGVAVAAPAGMVSPHGAEVQPLTASGAALEHQRGVPLEKRLPYPVEPRQVGELHLERRVHALEDGVPVHVVVPAEVAHVVALDEAAQELQVIVAGLRETEVVEPAVRGPGAPELRPVEELGVLPQDPGAGLGLCVDEEPEAHAPLLDPVDHPLQPVGKLGGVGVPVAASTGEPTLVPGVIDDEHLDPQLGGGVDLGVDVAVRVRRLDAGPDGVGHRRHHLASFVAGSDVLPDVATAPVGRLLETLLEEDHVGRRQLERFAGRQHQVAHCRSRVGNQDLVIRLVTDAHRPAGGPLEPDDEACAIRLDVGADEDDGQVLGGGLIALRRQLDTAA